jgi:hypothetical protein
MTLPDGRTSLSGLRRHEHDELWEENQDMTSFSHRHGYKPIKSIAQVESMDDDLRTSLWNELDTFYWKTAKTQYSLEGSDNREIRLLLQELWSKYFVLPLDTIGYSWSPPYSHIRQYFFGCSWNEAYDFIEFVPKHYTSASKKNDFFRASCNLVMEREVSGYRFIEDKIVPISSKEEIAEIEEAMRVPDTLSPVAIHLESALEKFSDRKSPDYRNSIKESISAVETISSLIAGKEKAELTDALKTLREKIEIHPALRDAFIKLYGYTSDEDGIRHALLEEPKLDSEDAKFMLIACSAFVNYLKVKAMKAGLHL